MTEQKTEAGQATPPTVVGQAAKALSTEINDLAAWGETKVTAQDVTIPRILVCQPMSKKVTAGEAAFGDFRESLGNEKVGDFNTPFEVVPFAMHKVFVEYELVQVKGEVKKEYLRVVPITPQNETLPYDDKETNEEGKVINISRDRVQNFYVLLPKELEIGGAIPHVISFRRSSSTAGKKLATQMFMRNPAAGKNPAAVMMKISAKKETNDDGTFAVLDVVPTKATPPEWQAEAFKWLTVVNSGKAKVDEASYNEETNTGNSTTTPRDVSPNGPEKF